jgi:NAD(P)-dependent dehydrogenase (short-subunit alcohol dehydrogenase family)
MRRRAREVVNIIVAAGGKAAAVQADLSCSLEVTRLLDQAEQTLGALHIVVANAAEYSATVQGCSCHSCFDMS